MNCSSSTVKQSHENGVQNTVLFVPVQSHENGVQNIIMSGEIQRQVLFPDLLKLKEFLQFAQELFNDHTLFALLFNSPASVRLCSSLYCTHSFQTH